MAALPSAGWVCVAKLWKPVGLYRGQLDRALGRDRHDALVLLDRQGLLPGHAHLKGPHVALLERPIVGRAVQVLLVSAHGDGVQLLLGDPRGPGYVVRRGDHRLPTPGVAGEVVHHPVLGDDLSPGPVRVRPDGVGSVGQPVGHQVEHRARRTDLHRHCGLVDGRGGSAAGLAEPDAGRPLTASERGDPRAPVEDLGLGHGGAVVDVVDALGVDPLFLQPGPAGLRAQSDGVRGGQAALPLGERRRVVAAEWDERLAEHQTSWVSKTGARAAGHTGRRPYAVYRIGWPVSQP